MSSPQEPVSANPSDLDAEEARRHRRILSELIDMGADLARHIHRQVTATDEPGPSKPGPAEPGSLSHVSFPDQIAAFDRVNRAVRRAILLARHIAHPPPSARTAPGPDRVAVRKRIIRDVEDAIQRAPRNNEALQAEFRDRLDSPDLEEEIATRPVENIILDIRRDLGLENWLGNHPWERRTPRNIEALRRRAAAPPQPTYTPAEHPPDISRPPNPNHSPHPPDPARELQESYAVARRLTRLL